MRAYIIHKRYYDKKNISLESEKTRMYLWITAERNHPGCKVTTQIFNVLALDILTRFYQITVFSPLSVRAHKKKQKTLMRQLFKPRERRPCVQTTSQDLQRYLVVTSKRDSLYANTGFWVYEAFFWQRTRWTYPKLTWNNNQIWIDNHWHLYYVSDNSREMPWKIHSKRRNSKKGRIKIQILDKDGNRLWAYEH